MNPRAQLALILSICVMTDLACTDVVTSVDMNCSATNETVSSFAIMEWTDKAIDPPPSEP